MSITDELREFANERAFLGTGYMDLCDIADHIDAEHQKAIRKLNNLADTSVLLPVDADGVPIRIGDELDYLEALHPDVPSRFKVQDMFYSGNGEWRLRAYPATYDPRKCRHYHAPTVEDVLREFALVVCGDDALTIRKGVVEEYAAKLQLKED